MVVTAENADFVIQLLAYIESRFAVGAEYSGGGISPTNEPYVVLTGGGWFETIAQAADDARAKFDSYAVDQVGTLYWRIRPEFELTKKGWRFYMRLLISNKSASHEVADA